MSEVAQSEPTVRRGDERCSVAVVGASGYTGAELVRLLMSHPRVRVAGLYGQSRAGKPVREVLPSLAGLREDDLLAFDPDAVEEDVVFCALPHGASAAVVDQLCSRNKTVLDLSADFRLRDLEVYRAWYGEHGAPERFGSAVYGLPELYRESIRNARLVAVPGCFPTAAVLGLVPLVSEGLIELDPVIVDAKTGASGAGRALSAATHFSEVGEGVRAYKTARRHRHTPEIEQELSSVAGSPMRVLFTPHLVPMTRGILSTSYVRPKSGITVERCEEAVRRAYVDSPSVVLQSSGIDPDTGWVRGSNRAMLSYSLEAETGFLIVQCVIDNLVKGAAGQAIQSMNLMRGWPESTGLTAAALWP